MRGGGCKYAVMHCLESNHSGAAGPPKLNHDLLPEKQGNPEGERCARLEKQRLRQQKVRESETEEERCARLEKQKLRQQKVREMQKEEERRARLEEQSPRIEDVQDKSLRTCQE